MDKKELSIRKAEDLDVDGVADLLEKWSQQEFTEFVREKEIDGRKLFEVTEGIVKLWRPRSNAIKFITFIEDIKKSPDKYFQTMKKGDETNLENDTEVDFKNEKKDIIINSKNETDITTNDEREKEEKTTIEAQYQTVNLNSKKKYENISNAAKVDEILKKIVPAKSFLYRNQTLKQDKPEKPVSSYLPMNSGKKPKRFFRLSSYEYPFFDWKKLRLSKNENFNDRGYYLVKTNNKDNESTPYRKTDGKTKYRPLSKAEELDEYPDNHFYEDLNYEFANKENDFKNTDMGNNNTKTYKDKLHVLFHTFKFPFLKKSQEVLEGETRLEEDAKCHETDKDGPIYENSDSVANMYDSISDIKEEIKIERTNTTNKNKTKLPVEDYLEPVQLNKDYSDVISRHREDSILGYILSLFESKFGMRTETTDDLPQEYSDPNPNPLTPERPADSRGHMSDRPLPVPVENEPYYMDIDRTEAENLLRGQPDGTFVLRPSSQPNHAYTLTISCASAVHNVGVRRRPDGRLALGYARRGERSFASVTSLLRHHGKRRLVLLAGGRVCGSTTLNSSPQYYQTPSNLPIDEKRTNPKSMNLPLEC